MYEAAGKHVICDMDGVDFEILDNMNYCEWIMDHAIKKSGATVLNIQQHKFEPNGLTILFLLSESHFSIHTYPDQNKCMLDAFTCGDKDPEVSMNVMIDAFKPTRFNMQTIQRGFDT
jgi:S-adenosylmethionine decarboxylase